MTPREIAAKLTRKARRELLLIDDAPTPQRCWCEGLWTLDLVQRANPRWQTERVVTTDLGRAVAAALREAETP